MWKVVGNMQKCTLFALNMKKNIHFHFCLRQVFASEEYLSDGPVPSIKKKIRESIR